MKAKLTKLDFYIIKKFLGTFFYAVSLIICVSIVIDLAEKIDDLIQNKANLKAIIFDYYIYFIPWLYNLYNNLFIFIAVVFFTSRLAMRSEIVAILAAGVSYQRLMRPYILSALFLGGISWLLNAWFIPYCNQQKADFENTYINGRRNAVPWQENVHRQISPGVFMFIENFNKKDSVGYRFTLETFEKQQLVNKISAERLSFNRDSACWKIENYTERVLSPKSKVTKGTEKNIQLDFNPEVFFLRRDDVGIFNNRELNEVIEAEKMRGAEKIEYYLVERYRRHAMPFSTLLLSIIGLTVASRKVRGGIGLHIGFGLAIAFSYVFVSQLTFTFAHAGDLSPLMAVWLPNIMFSILAFVLYRMAPK